MLLAQTHSRSRPSLKEIKEDTIKILKRTSPDDPQHGSNSHRIFGIPVSDQKGRRTLDAELLRSLKDYYMLFFSFILMVLVLFAAWREHKAASSDSDKEMGA